MGATKQTSIYPVGLLQRARTRNNKDALAEIPATLAGNIATLRGVILGGDTLDADTVNPAPLNPGSSQRGHDHSGGLYGAPLFRTIASWNFDDHASITANITANQSPNEFAIEAAASETIYTPTAFLPLMLWVPGCDPGERGAYQGLGVRTVWYIEATSGGSSGDRLKLEVENRRTGTKVTLETSGTTSTGTKITASADDGERLHIAPGELNHLIITTIFKASAVAGSRVLTARLIALELGVYAT